MGKDCCYIVMADRLPPRERENRDSTLRLQAQSPELKPTLLSLQKLGSFCDVLRVMLEHVTTYNPKEAGLWSFYASVTP